MVSLDPSRTEEELCSELVCAGQKNGDKEAKGKEAEKEQKDKKKGSKKASVKDENSAAGKSATDKSKEATASAVAGACFVAYMPSLQQVTHISQSGSVDEATFQEVLVSFVSGFAYCRDVRSDGGVELRRLRQSV